MKTVYDVGLGHEEFKARGESGEYRPDLGRYFLDGMRQPPRVGFRFAQPADSVMPADTALPVLNAATSSRPRALKTKEES